MTSFVRIVVFLGMASVPGRAIAMMSPSVKPAPISILALVLKITSDDPPPCFEHIQLATTAEKNNDLTMSSIEFPRISCTNWTEKDIIALLNRSSDLDKQADA